MPAGAADDHPLDLGDPLLTAGQQGRCLVFYPTEITHVCVPTFMRDRRELAQGRCAAQEVLAAPALFETLIYGK